jgi:hypothetical protein
MAPPRPQRVLLRISLTAMDVSAHVNGPADVVGAATRSMMSWVVVGDDGIEPPTSCV